MDDNKDQSYEPEQSGMYELEFPAPQLSSSDGRGPVMIHALEGFSDAGHAIRLAARHLKDTLDTELVASFAIDELLDYRSRRPLMTFKTDHFTHYDEPELSLYALHDSVGTPFLLLAGMEPDLRWERFITAVRLLAERLGRPPDHRARHHPDGGAAHPADHADRPRQQQGTDRRPHTVGGRGAGPRQRVQPAGVPDGPARPRCRRVHRARAALPGPDRLPCGRRGAADPGRQVRVAAAPAVCAGRCRPSRWPTKVNEQVEASAEVAQVVEALERQYDAFVAAQENQSLLARDEDLPSGDELGAEFERFLAQQARDREKRRLPRRGRRRLGHHPVRQRGWAAYAAVNEVDDMTTRKPNLRPVRELTPTLAVPHHSRLPARVPDRRVGSRDPADPRHRRQLHDVEQRAVQARSAVHRHRARPAGPREVRQAARRLLGGRLRQRHARPAQRARHRAGHRGRPLARRRRGHAIRLPVPAIGGPADPGRRRRRDQGRQRRAADRVAADGQRGARPAAAADGAARVAGGGTGRRRAVRLDRRRPRPARTCCGSSPTCPSRPRRRRSPARCARWWTGAARW